MPKILKTTRFGNPVLRQVARKLSIAEMKSEYIQTLIADMYYTLAHRKYGVGMAAPQVGRGIAMSVIAIKPTPNRPELEPFESVIINPEIVETYGRRVQKWEGCVSCGKGKDTLFAKVTRYKSIKLRWHDESGKEYEEILDSFVAHVAQHEVDHLNGVLFVDRVSDTTSYMMSDEYRKRIVEPAMKAKKNKLSQ